MPHTLEPWGTPSTVAAAASSGGSELAAWVARLGLEAADDGIGLPPYGDPGSSPSRGAITSTSDTPAAERQMTCAALDALLPIVYGQVRVGALLANAFSDGFTWIFWILWCEGPIDSIVSLTMNDAELPTGSTVEHRLGTPDQTVVSLLQTIFTAQGINDFNETLGYPTTGTGIAHSVIRVPQEFITSPPRFNATIKGRKIYDQRKDSTNGGSGSHRLADASTWEWSDNPSLILSDYARNTVFGGGYTIADWSKLTECANANDAVIGAAPNTEKSRLAALSIDSESSVDNWMDTMRAMAAVFIYEDMGALTIIPDAPGSPSATYSHAAGQILAIDQVTLLDASALPTYQEVRYTDTSSLPWKDATVSYKRSGVDSGATPWRRSDLPLPWVTRGSQAMREAIERNNKAWLRDLTFRVHIMDEGICHPPGDLIAITFPDLGWTALKVRVTAAAPTAQGWMLTVQKEDDNAYNSSVQAVPGVTDTNFPSPDEPPAMGAIDVVEDLYTAATGLWASRLVVTWDAVAWPFVDAFAVEIKQNGVVKDTALVPNTALQYVSKALTENLVYDVTVSVVSINRTAGAPASFTITNSARKGVPTDASFLDGVEVGGEVRLVWGPASDKDLTAHEIRYGATGGSWASATVLERVPMPSTHYETSRVASGTWRFYVKGLDSYRDDPSFPYGQESVNAKTKDITVTSDANAFLVGQHDFTTPTLSRMAADINCWVTDAGVAWNTMFPNAVNTYTNVVDTYGSPSPSMLVTENYDFGASVTGDWIGGVVYTNLSGTATNQVQVSAGATGSKFISGATNTNPIEITTTTNHNYSTGDEVQQTNVGGNTAANGRFKITVIDPTTYYLQDLNGVNVAGNGNYTSGGGAAKWVWTSFSGSGKATARYARNKISTTGAMRVTSLGSVSCTAVTRDESGSVNSSSSGAATVTLSGAYVKVVSITLTPKGGTTTPRYAVYDNVVIGTPCTFDVYCFDAAGNKVNLNEVQWHFRGV